MSELTQAELKSIVHYNPATGEMRYRYKKTTRGRDSCRGGKLVGTCGGRYINIVIGGVRTTAHRLAWLYMTGYLPENDIDHINHDGRDNRWSNLRHVSRICNMRNSKLSGANTSGIKGVHYDTSRSSWMASVRVGYKRYNLGRYIDFDDAVCARLAAEQCLNWVNCDSDSTAYRYVRDNIINTHQVARNRAPTSQGDRPWTTLQQR